MAPAPEGAVAALAAALSAALPGRRPSPRRWSLPRPFLVALVAAAGAAPRRAAAEQASITFHNEVNGDEDVFIYWVKPSPPAWPPAPPLDSTDAVQVRCRLAHREALATDAHGQGHHGSHRGHHHPNREKDLQRLKQELKVRGNFTITVRKDWAPRGAARFLELVRLGFFDGCCLFRAVKNFLVQFGVSSDAALQKSWGSSRIIDDPPMPEMIPLPRGILAFAGAGKDTRTTQLWLSFGVGVAGSQPWETPVGFVHPTKGGLDIMDTISTAYGDLSLFGGRAPEPSKIEQPEGIEYLQNYPKIDYFESCAVQDGGQVDSEASTHQQPDLIEVGVLQHGEAVTQSTVLGHRFAAKLGGLDGRHLGYFTVSEHNQNVHLVSPNEL